MVKKIKHLVVFMLFSFLYSLLSSKVSEAAKVCLVPKTESGKLKYNGISVDTVNASSIAAETCGISGDISY